MTAATAALDPGPLITGSGSGATADDTTATPGADFGRWEREFAADTGCSHPIQLRSRTDMIDLATGELAPSTARRPPHAATAARPSARPARRCTSGTPASSSARAWPEAKASPRRSPRTRACSPPSPPPPSARSTPAACAARPCCPAAPAATPTPGAARTAGTSPARPGTSRATPASASRCARPATTTNRRCCSTPTRRTLWRRFVTYLPRHLARLAGVTQKTLRAQLRIRFVKVAEYQARGVVHFHAVIRLDAPGEDYQPPPPGITADLLCDAIDQAAAAVRLVIDHDGQAVALGFGPQTDTRTIRHGSELPGTGQALNGQAVANYIAKYATKTLSAPACPACGSAAKPTSTSSAAPPTTGAMITAAWQLGSTRHAARFRAWAHMLGYGGHFLTKSRRYSVTFGQLRAARADHRRATRPRNPAATPGAGPSMRPSSWSSAPPGATPGSATLRPALS